MRRAILLACAGLAVGCAGQNAQLTTCQTEKEQLLTTIRGQRETTRTLSEQVASLETRLDQAETELARAGGGNTRLSSRPSAAPPAAKAESLPWRPPAKAEPKAKASENRQSRSGAAGANVSGESRLLDLARRDGRVKYDASARAARVDVPVTFSEQQATLTAEDKRRLDDVSKLLRSDEARDLQIMVAGVEPARAQAVADYLDRHGIAQERLAVSGNASRKARESGSGVEIYLLDADAPLAGFVPQGEAKRR
jgi:outer membrane protein OmpA-like peptidoglycan-associated protein